MAGVLPFPGMVGTQQNVLQVGGVGGIQIPMGKNYQNYPGSVGHISPPPGYNVSIPTGQPYQGNLGGFSISPPQVNPQHQVYPPPQFNHQQGGIHLKSTLNIKFTLLLSLILIKE